MYFIFLPCVFRKHQNQFNVIHHFDKRIAITNKMLIDNTILCQPNYNKDLCQCDLYISVAKIVNYCIMNLNNCFINCM